MKKSPAFFKNFPHFSGKFLLFGGLAPYPAPQKYPDQGNPFMKK
jgi:hypothetical protein